MNVLVRRSRAGDDEEPSRLAIRAERFVDPPAGKSAITDVPNKEEFPWHLLLLPVKWTASLFWTLAGGSLWAKAVSSYANALLEMEGEESDMLRARLRAMGFTDEQIEREIVAMFTAGNSGEERTE